MKETNTYAEAEVLGVILVDGTRALAGLSPALFADRGHRALFEASVNVLSYEPRPVEDFAVLVSRELTRAGKLRLLASPKEGITGALAIALLMQGVTSQSRSAFAQNVQWLRAHAVARGEMQ